MKVHFAEIYPDNRGGLIMGLYMAFTNWYK